MRILTRPGPGPGGNPYTHLLYAHMEQEGVHASPMTRRRVLRGDAAILHVHWPTHAVAHARAVDAVAHGGRLLAAAAAAKARGARLVWTVHNLVSHDRRHPVLERTFMRAFTRLVDGVIALSPAGLHGARDRHPNLVGTPAYVVPHGHYRDAYPNACTRFEAREALGLPDDAFVFAYFGLIRPYKDVPGLVTAFRALDDPSAVLDVSGAPVDAEEEARVVSATGSDPRVRTTLEFVPDERVQLHLRAADVVVLPFRHLLNSGSALLALSFDTPVLVPAIGAMTDLEADVGSEWVMTYDGQLTADTLRNARAWVVSTPRGAHAPLDGHDWALVARHTAAAFREVAGAATLPRSAVVGPREAA